GGSVADHFARAELEKPRPAETNCGSADRLCAGDHRDGFVLCAGAARVQEQSQPRRVTGGMVRARAALAAFELDKGSSDGLELHLIAAGAGVAGGISGMRTLRVFS